MKILSDFDGVLTDLAEEAARVRALFVEAIQGVLADAGDAARTLVRTAEAAMADDPAAHGWRVEGRLTAYADEDEFIRVNGLAAALDQMAAAGHTLALKAAAGLPARGSQDFKALAQLSYTRMTRETARGAHHPLDPAAARVLTELASCGHEVVVVSNSGTQRVIELLENASLRPVAHARGATGALRVRGDARKFVLGRGTQAYRAGKRIIETDRPHYAAILEEEQPDVVVGDVFSLDLALPIRLAAAGILTAGRFHVLLRRRPYTPEWSVAHLSSFAPSRIRARVIGSLDELLEVAPRP